MDGLQVSTLAEDRLGRLWIAAGHRLFSLQAGRLSVARVSSDSDDLQITDVVGTTDRTLWALTRKGLYRLDAQGFRPFQCDTERVGKVEDLLAPGRDGSIWVISNRGLVHIQGDTCSLFWEFSATSPLWPMTLIEDRAGTVWSGTRGAGLVHITNGRPRVFTRNEGLPDNFVFELVEQGDDFLWVGSQNGIFRISRSGLQSGVQATSAAAPVYTTLDGMRSNSCETDGLLGAIQTHDGHLWFVTGNGLAMIDPTHLPKVAITPPVVESVTVDGQVLGGEGFKALPGDGNIQILYTSTSMRVPSRIRFRHTLEGFDQNWSRETAERRIEYTNLAPGHYRFRVIASAGDGAWTEPEGTFGFALTPHLYQTTWFRILTVLCLAISAAFIFRWRLRHLRARAEGLEKFITDRTCELERLSLLDGLTGVSNRRHFDQSLSLEWARAQNEHRPLSLIMLDIDHFKALNDRYGHPQGDTCLVRVAATLRQRLRNPADLVARYGGEEFAIMLPNTDAPQAALVADELHRAVQMLSIPHQESPHGKIVTASFGVATMQNGQVSSSSQLIADADEALYQAKRKGRNLVVISGRQKTFHD